GGGGGGEEGGGGRGGRRLIAPRVARWPLPRLTSLGCPLPAARGEGHGVRGPVCANCARLNVSKLTNSHTISPPVWSGLGFARLFSRPPKNEGAWRARADARRRNAPVQRATGFSRFRVPRCPDQGQPLVAGGVLPGSARGCSCEPHPRVPAPSHLHDAS